MKHILRVIPVLIFLSVLALAPFIVRDSIANQNDKADLAEISHIKYGLFSVNVWKKHLSKIMYEEIKKLDLKATAKDLKGTVEAQLTALITQVYTKLKETNRKSFGGRVKQFLIDTVVDIEEVKKNVPSYADTLIAELTKPETETKIKSMATKQLRTYMNSTFEDQDMTLVNAIVKSNGAKSIADASRKIQDRITARDEALNFRTAMLVGLSLALFIWAWAERSCPGRAFKVLMPTLVVLLAVGVTTPMIDLDARITELTFQLMGHKIQFQDQSLYFQSKSVLDVFWLMVTHKDIQMKIVGILMVLFSVVFPLIKMALSVAYHYDLKKSRQSRVVNFFVFKSGKWSMADVLVVAIFMAFIGFNGVIASQFNKLSSFVPADMTFLTTNGTTLQLGFFVFMTYAILALFLSAMLDSSKARGADHQPMAKDVPEKEPVRKQLPSMASAASVAL